MEDQKIIKEINRYIKGELGPAEIDELWVEFLKNPEYYEWFETELHLIKLAKDQKSGNIHPLANSKKEQINSFQKYKKWALAAAAVLVLSVGLQIFSLSGEDAIYNQAITSIEYSEMAGADVYRSDDDVTDDLDVIINQGLAYAYNGDEKRAIETFKNILNNNPNKEQRARAEMNLGILFYNSGEYSEAVTHFTSITENEEVNTFFKEKAWWFLGNAYLNLRELTEARQAVFNAYTLDGRYQSPALSLLKKLDLELGIIPKDPDEN